MKTNVLLLALLLTGSITSLSAQNTPANFQGAEPTKAHYQAIYQINYDDETKIKSALRNIQNAIDDPRLSGKLEVELIVHGSGVALYQKDKSFEAQLLELQKKGVILAMCENTMRVLKISRDALFPFISYVPSGNGELILRQQQGWAYVHP